MEVTAVRQEREGHNTPRRLLTRKNTDAERTHSTTRAAADAIDKKATTNRRRTSRATQQTTETGREPPNQARDYNEEEMQIAQQRKAKLKHD